MAYTIVYVIFFLYLCGVFEKRVAMKLRKLGIVVLGCVLLMEMAACSKDKEEVSPDGSTPAQVDPRDAFVGDYTYEATGFMHINDLPLPLFDLIGLYSGGVKLNPPKFLAVCFAGKAIKMLIFVLLVPVAIDMLKSMDLPIPAPVRQQLGI